MAFSDQLGMRLRVAYLALHRRFQAHFARFGATADQFVVLTLLAEQEGVIQRELVRRSGSDANTMAALVGLLERRGWVRRRRAPDDGRARCVFLTPAGRRLQRRLARSSQALHRRLTAAVAADDLAVVLRSLEHVAAAMAHSRAKSSPSSSSTPKELPCAP